ncbi:hypothetical protein ACFL3E_01790 [Patescibacteria group bacterium]
MPDTTLDDIVNKIIDVAVFPIIELLFVIASLVFIFGVIEYIWKADSDEGRISGKRHMIWGLIGLFIMVAASSIIQLFCVFFYDNACGIL